MAVHTLLVVKGRPIDSGVHCMEKKKGRVMVSLQVVFILVGSVGGVRRVEG